MGLFGKKKPAQKNNLTYSLEWNGSIYRASEIDKNLFEDAVSGFNKDEWDFIILTPSEPINGSIYLQAGAPTPQCPEISVEIRFNSTGGGFKHYSYLTNNVGEIVRFFTDYLELGKTPDVSNWEDVTEQYR